MNAETIGIEGMRERALLGSGTLDIESRRGEGTTVTLRLPVDATP
jgi:signal transduction histidine kinase